MNIATLAEMAAEGNGDRIAFGSLRDGLTYSKLWDRVRRAGMRIEAFATSHLSFVDTNSVAFPILIFGSALANTPFVPLNYRLARSQIEAILQRIAPTTCVVGPMFGDVVGADHHPVARSAMLSDLDRVDVGEVGDISDPESVAILLFTSGTSGQPKAAVLRHRNLTAYVIDTVEFMGAADSEAALVSVPPYHIAGISAVLSNVYAGRRIVQMESFDPKQWVHLAESEAITHAMVVPTMLDRILDWLAEQRAPLSSLRHLSYGGGRMPLPTIERAMQALPHVDFVNAYGLTETSSTVAILSPQDHREAFHSSDPKVRSRLGSVGRPISSLSIEIRSADGTPVGASVSGEIFVRGEQISGEYIDSGVVLRDGWFPTNDGGYLDDGGYLFLDGRIDDVIVRGGENISPGEIEDALVTHPAISEACVVGIPDSQWGEAIAAMVVVKDDATPGVEELQHWVRERLRSSRVPQRVEFSPNLPYTDTGKLLRREVKRQLTKSE